MASKSGEKKMMDRDKAKRMLWGLVVGDGAGGRASTRAAAAALVAAVKN
jgi:hypothetical protein